MTSAIILAAGKGTRMKSDGAKCMQLVLNQPILSHIIGNLKSINIEDIVVVVGHQGQTIIDYFKDQVQYAWQREQLGTGHAVMQAQQLKAHPGKTLVINGDVPLLKPDTLNKLIAQGDDSDLVLMSTIMPDPAKYGRIIRSENGKFIKIIEAKDCTDQELSINEINGGIYCFDNIKLFECLPLLKNDNRQQEFYITDLVDIFLNKGYQVDAMVADDFQEIMGVDHRMGQLAATKALQHRINNQHLMNGVCLMDMDSIYIDPEVIIENDVVIESNVQIKGTSLIRSGSIIKNGSIIVNSQIANNVTITNSQIVDCEVGSGTTVGPMAHLRGHCVIGENCRIGNFVEMKKTIFGNGSKCAHLSYLGDAIVGEKVNIGCGVVTVNYDGKHKHQTIIKDEAFVGSNANLLAPITIGYRALVAAGSTVNKDVPDGDMGIARAKQENKTGFGYQYNKK